MGYFIEAANIAVKEYMMDFKNIPVDEYSSPCSVTTTEDADSLEIYKIMEESGVRHIPVVKDGKPVGIISDRDLRLVVLLHADTAFPAKEFMVRDPFCVQKGSSIDEVAFEMSSRKIGSALVVDEHGELDSIFTSTDGLNALIEVVRGDA